MVSIENFPRTAIIQPDNKESAYELMEFLRDYGFTRDTGRAPDEDYVNNNWTLNNGGTCFDIETENLTVYNCTKHYYEHDFESEHPELYPEDGRFIFCSVRDFIAMCTGNDCPEFEAATDEEMSGLLFG